MLLSDRNVDHIIVLCHYKAFLKVCTLPDFPSQLALSVTKRDERI